MKKILCTLFVALFSLSFMLIPASADDFNTLDPTGLFTDDEIQSLEQLAVDIEADFGYFAMVCFADNINGYDTVRDYGQMLYDTYSDCDNAIIFVHDINQSLCDFFVAEDYEEYVFDDSVTTAIFNTYNEAETYYLGAVAFYNGVYAALENAAALQNEETTVEETASETTTATEKVTEAVNADVATTEGVEETTEFVKTERVLPLVVDNADLLTDDEEKTLIEKCDAFADKRQAEIAIVTITDLEGKTSEEYANNFYDINGYGYGENKDGILLLYLPGAEGERQIALIRNGIAKEQISNEEVDVILDAAIAYLVYENYIDGFSAFISEADSAIMTMPSIFWVIICLAAGIVIGLLITNKMAAANYSVYKNAAAADYVREGSLMITGRNDVFSHSRVNATPKPKSKSSSSSSSSHTSSSGGSRGSSSRTF